MGGGEARGQMDAMAEDPVRKLLSGYARKEGVADELIARDGSMQKVWRPLIELLARETPESLDQRFARGDQYLQDAGVFFRQYTDAGSTQRDWPLAHVPVMIDAKEWSALEAGVKQRADLLERVIADLYGPGDLVRGGYLPAELVAGNREWLRPMVGVAPRGGRYLHFLAFELGRSPDGSWFVLCDRAQAPSGAGFAIENRMATVRVLSDLFPSLNVERLGGFFHAFRNAIYALRDAGDGQEGRVAVLTPGQQNDAYFEHAYIARFLGFMLLEGEDLTVDKGRLMVRTIHGLQPVSVLWRRLDSLFADPLELDDGSALGAPGMVGALRAGGFAMLNCLGSGVLETRAMLAFLPRLAEKLLGEPLKLQNIATWWCGQSTERSYVKDNLDRLMIGSAQSTRLPFAAEDMTVLGGGVRGAARASVVDWLEAEGAKLVGQEAVTLSTTPAMVEGKLTPRPMVVRVFAARTEEGWTVMPGGYARIGRNDDPTALAMHHGGSVADVWVVGDEPVTTAALSAQTEGPFVRRTPGVLPSRAADNLFWLGRYVERVESRSRELRAYHLRLAEFTEGSLPLLGYLADHLRTAGLDPAVAAPKGLLDVFDRALACAEKVRDRFSTDGWNAISDLAKTARRFEGRTEPGADAALAMSLLLRRLAGFSGLLHENMFRFSGWRFLTLGRSLERADNFANLLAAFADLGAPPGGFDLAVEVGDSVLTHRRRYAMETNRNTVIDLLALDPDNPRSIRFQIEQARREVEHLLTEEERIQATPLTRALILLETELTVASPDEIHTGRLTAMRDDIANIASALGARFWG